MNDHVTSQCGGLLLGRRRMAPVYDFMTMNRDGTRAAPRLRAIERFNIGVARTVNERRILKRMSHAFLRVVGARWVYLCTRNLLHVIGEDALDALRPERGVILVANHRSFFDF